MQNQANDCYAADSATTNVAAMHPQLLNRAAPMLFVLLWSTGFIGAKFGLPYAEPFSFLAIRFAIVCSLLLLITLISRASWPTSKMAYIHISISGLLIHGCYLGGVFAAIDLGVSAGTTAVIVSAQPILTAVLAGRLLGERVKPLQWLGFVCGFIGVALVVWEKINFSSSQLLGFSYCIAALLAITFGTLYQKRYCGEMTLRSGSLIQYMAAGIMLSVLALCFEQSDIIWTGDFIFALLWLSFVLSIGAISLLMLLIRNGAATKVASLFYLVPPATAVIAFFMFDERLAAVALMGIALTALGVALVNKT